MVLCLLASEFRSATRIPDCIRCLILRIAKSKMAKLTMVRGSLSFASSSSLMSETNDITAVLQRINRGEPGARESLLRLVESELHLIAERYMRRERPDHTLEATVLVDDAFLRLFGEGANLTWENRTHFYRAAAKAMRQLLIDHARHKKAAKRPPPDRKLSPEALSYVAADAPETDWLALHEALEKLAGLDARQCQVVELHYFSGHTMNETARVLGISLTTAKEEWTAAKAWLHRELSR